MDTLEARIAIALEQIAYNLKLQNLHLEQQTVFLSNLVETLGGQPHELQFTEEELSG